MSKELVGGQAVIEGVMMRFQDTLSIAVRTPRGDILVHTRDWWRLTQKDWQKRKFIRGFFVLLETLVNGIKALNFSAQHALDEEEEMSPRAIFFSMVLAIGFAILLFVVLPHLFSIFLNKEGLCGNINSLSFHLWDGVAKFVLFLAYVITISFIPDIRRVFEYHGAEHKTIYAYENALDLTYDNIKPFSRLHPRCGTSFLLFVLAISILIFSIVVPLTLQAINVSNFWLKHVIALGLKILLMIPISGLAYELIKIAGKNENSLWCKILCLPGLFFQLFTTKEPDEKQVEVAIAALKGAIQRGEHVS
ncbi:MAG: DUF1385 domain-containing protein [Desulfonauticus sp.]|nr:DUF1385 domain-containing protein [Desulfonauticus sp.]